MGRFRAALDLDPVLVVPTADDVAAFERELAGGAATLGGSIATFDALAGEIAAALALAPAPELTASQRQALVRAAIDSTDPGRLRRSASRPGFAPALARLIAELEAALISPAEFALIVDGLDDAGYERELSRFYARYAELREASGRGDRATTVAAAIRAVRDDPKGWRARPLLVYGFDDLSRAQLELVGALGRAADVTVAVTFAERRALEPRAKLVSLLKDEYGATIASELEPDESYAESAALRHLDRFLFEPRAERIASDDGLVLLESAGTRGEAEAVGIEIARLLESGHEPGEIVIVLRRPDPGGRLLATVLREMGIPVALESSVALSATQVGGALISLCRAAADETAVEALLGHLRLDPALAPAAVDTVEARIRRGDATTVSEAVAHWENPPRHIERLREAETAPARLRALARSARELAEAPHRERAPVGRARGEGGAPFSALEMRAGVAAAELLTELAGIGTLGCDVPDLAGAIEAIESASVPLWRGPATGRVRILDPYRARAARARALFCLSLQDGEFPTAAPPDPLLSEDRRREIGNPDLRRTDPADEERYLFASCVSRPTEHLYLSWQSCDEDGTALARSPFLDEVFDLLEPGTEMVRKRGPERAVPTVSEATVERDLARALAVGGWAFERGPVLEAAGVADREPAIEALFAGLPDPNDQPGPLSSPVVLAELGGRGVFSAGSLEGWVTCSYKWFVEHELSPQRLEPTADPLWLGSIVHAALERLYRDRPGSDSIPRPGDLAAWQQRFAELLDEVAAASGGPLNHARRAALARARAQGEEFLAVEAETETEFRPRPDLLEVAFGPFDEEAGGDAPGHEALAIGDLALRGRIDRIDVDPAGRAVVRDYKTGRKVPTAAKFADEGKLQIQLYMRAAERILGLDAVAGLYHPLGAVSDRKPRGIMAREHEDLKALGIVGTDRLEADDFRRALDDAERVAVDAAAEMRAGLIRRNPIGGRCPKYCTFQAICRLERAMGVDENGNGG